MKNTQSSAYLAEINKAVKEAYREEKAKHSFSYLSLNEVLKESGCRSAQTLYSWIRGGKFPAPFRLVKGGRAVGWRSDEVQEWKETRERASIMEA